MTTKLKIYQKIQKPTSQEMIKFVLLMLLAHFVNQKKYRCRETRLDSIFISHVLHTCGTWERKYYLVSMYRFIKCTPKTNEVIYYLFHVWTSALCIRIEKNFFIHFWTSILFTYNALCVFRLIVTTFHEIIKRIFPEHAFWKAALL